VAYEALARKYRPRTFDELVGQKPIVRTLTNAIRAGRIHHAYVFSGVRGVGKTTVARIFAKALNCEKGPTPTPCLACPACLEIAAGQDLDVIEMDAASRTGVDDVRDLIDTTRYAPARDRYKVFIVDEFHMLSKPAFNALLKTLEEPPPRVVFIMATTELHKVPGTVLSRTQQFDFRKVSVAEITDLLARIAKDEGIVAPLACLETLARAGDGSVRDAESLLDQAIASCGSSLDEDSLRALLGLVPDETLEAFFGAAADRDAGRLLALVASVVAEGHDLRVFLAGLIDGARRLLLLRALDDPSEILGLEKDHQARLAGLAGRFETVGLLRILSILMSLEGPLKYSEQPRYVLEAAAIRLAMLADLTPIEELIARFEAEGPGAGPRDPASSRGAARGAPAASPSPPPTPGRRPPTAAAPPTGRKPEGSEADPAGERPSEPLVRNDEPPPPDDDDAPGFDRDPGGAIGDDLPSPELREAPSPARERGPDAARFLSVLHERKMSLAVLVEQAGSILAEGNRIVLAFDDSKAFARKSVQSPANLAALREIARAALGREVEIEIARDGQSGSEGRLAGTESAAPAAGPRSTAAAPASKPRATPDSAAAIEPGGDTDSSSDSAPGSASPSGPAATPMSEARRRRLIAEAEEDPLVKTLLERFDGRIVEVMEAQ